MSPIPFTRPTLTGREEECLKTVLSSAVMTEGPFGKKCEALLKERTGALSVLMTPSCTAALEAAIILADIQPGDEVICPSYTFTSTATAIVMRGGVPVFVDCRSDDMNIDPAAIKQAITPKTKAVMIMHYGGMACDMEAIVDICRSHTLFLIEDAAQAYPAFYKGRALGSFGDAAAFSFHHTKNLNCGEGGALLINNPDWVKRAEIIRDKGSNRAQFFRGEVDKYNWQDIGSSYVLSEVQAAVLWPQLEATDRITEHRLSLWSVYHHKLHAACAARGIITSSPQPDAVHNAHLFYLIFPDMVMAAAFKAHMDKALIKASYHYVPLHSSPAGKKFGRASGLLTTTEKTDGCLLRLPLYHDMTGDGAEYIANIVLDFIDHHASFLL